MIKGLHHVGMATGDLDRLVAFYTERFFADYLHEFSWGEDAAEMSARLGLERSSGRLVFLGLAGAGLEIFQFDFPDVATTCQLRSVAKPGFSHICLEVDDCAAEYNRLTEAGMVFHGPPLTMPVGGIFTYGRDPDGNVVELLQRPPA
ncbi:MAG: VOC family protein [Paracoccaceae bacterium]|nr:VOC family protein [Paracoccaceae bacterium]MDE2915427.1 VOC family protein [Paracoccaceae bacterium]